MTAAAVHRHSQTGKTRDLPGEKLRHFDDIRTQSPRWENSVKSIEFARSFIGFTAQFR
jgi:hypothetical protein